MAAVAVLAAVTVAAVLRGVDNAEVVVVGAAVGAEHVAHGEPVLTPAESQQASRLMTWSNMYFNIYYPHVLRNCIGYTKAGSAKPKSARARDETEASAGASFSSAR